MGLSGNVFEVREVESIRQNVLPTKKRHTFIHKERSHRTNESDGDEARKVIDLRDPPCVPVGFHRHASKISATLSAMVCSRLRAWALRVSSSSFRVSSCSLKSPSLTASPTATPT